MRTPATRQLILTTALTLPLTAAGAGMTYAQSDNACAELEAFLEQDMPEGVSQTEEELNRVLEAGDPEQCAVVNVEIERAVQTAQQNQQQNQQTTPQQQSEQAQAEQQQTEEQVVESESTRVQLSDEVVVEGEVFVEQQPPEVDVEAGQTEVIVRDSQPEVTLGGEAPEILVREAPARVQVDMPQPTITIERQPPEIIVTMPPANVDVANARPQIEVRQSEPNVTVRHTNPTVDLQLSQAENPEESQGVRVRDRQSGEEMAQGETSELTDVQANVSQAEPVVTYEESEDQQQQQATVQDQRGQPNVRYETSDPQVEVRSSGEPQVQVTQAGEPRITFREAGETQQAASGADQQGDAQPQQMAATEQSGQQQQTGGQLQAEDVERTAQAQQPQEGQEGAQEGAQIAQTGTADQSAQTADQPAQGAGGEATQLSDTQLGTNAQEGGGQQEVAQTEGQQGTRPNIQREGYEMTEASQVQVEQLTGTDVYGVNDENIGEIGDIVMNSAGEVEHVIVDVGGFLGLGQKPVAVDFGEVTVLRQQGGDDLRAYVDATQEELENMPRYEQ